MPPKAKFTKEEIIGAALRIAERDGLEALTARTLGKELGSSARPIFTIFQSMDEVTEALYKRANAVYGAYVEEGLKEKPAFRGVGRAYIRFSAEHPRLFQLLFMRERDAYPDKDSVLRGIEEHYEDILSSITSEYGVTHEQAKRLYLQLWIYSHGIAVLTATKVCAFTQSDLTDMLGEAFRALLIKIKTEETA